MNDPNKTSLEQSVQAMHQADDEHGLGFYNDFEWRKHYQESRRLVGMESQEDVSEGDKEIARLRKALEAAEDLLSVIYKVFPHIEYWDVDLTNKIKYARTKFRTARTAVAKKEEVGEGSNGD